MFLAPSAASWPTLVFDAPLMVRLAVVLAPAPSPNVSALAVDFAVVLARDSILSSPNAVERPPKARICAPAPIVALVSLLLSPLRVTVLSETEIGTKALALPAALAVGVFVVVASAEKLLNAEMAAPAPIETVFLFWPLREVVWVSLAQF